VPGIDAVPIAPWPHCRSRALAAPATPRSLHCPAGPSVTWNARARPPGQNEGSWLHELRHDRSNEPLHLLAFDAATWIVLRRTDVDHRVELDPVIGGFRRIEVDAPEIRLLRAVVEQPLLLVCVELAADDHHPAATVDHGFDHVAEARLRELIESCTRDRAQYWFQGRHDRRVYRSVLG